MVGGAIATWAAGKAVEWTGIKGVNWVLKVLSPQIVKKIKDAMIIEVPSNGHYVLCSEAEKNISFDVQFNRHYPAKLEITRIDYQVIYKGITRQSNHPWYGSVTLDTNHIRLPIHLLYYTAESLMGLPSSPVGFKLTGTATIKCMYGTFNKSFESTVLTVVSDSPWEQLRKEVAQYATA